MKTAVTLLSWLLACQPVFSQCTATAAMTGTSFNNDASIGSLAWSSVADVQLSDNSNATAGQLVALLSTVQSKYITVEGLGFSIPSGASICGIEVEVDRFAAGLIIGSSVKDNSIRIIKNGSITGAEMASASSWPGSEATATYGSNSNQWGTSWTPADINAANFGIAISAKLSAGLAGVFLTANIDQVRVTVYYDFLLAPGPLYFKAQPLSQTMQLNWAVPPGRQNNYFIVEKSTDALNWRLLETVQGRSEGTKLATYQVMDPSPEALTYYRLKHVDDNDKIVVDYTISARYSDPVHTGMHVWMDAYAHRAMIECREGIKSVRLFDTGMRPVQIIAGENGPILGINLIGRTPGIYLAQVYTTSGKIVTTKLLVP